MTAPYYADDTVTLHHGDCLDVMRAMPDASVDSVVTDPPYGLEFMGREWDSFRGDVGRGVKVAEQRAEEMTPAGVGHSTPGGPYLASRVDSIRSAGAPFQSWCQLWATECLRVLKPGGYLLAFGGSRTWHRLACGIEDAGFEMRDSIAWLYGSGFPKSSSPYRSTMGALCQYHASAPHAVRISRWLPAESPEAKGPIAHALAETQPEGDLVLLTRTGRADGSSEVTATWLSDFLTADTIWNTVSSWPGFSADRWDAESTSIIATASRATTAPRTSNSSPSRTTPDITPPDVSRPDGCSCDAVPVVGSSSDVEVRPNRILIPTATAPVIAPLAPMVGLGTAAKPAFEPIVVARKPIQSTVAANVLKYGTGALNVDGCRVGNQVRTFGGPESYRDTSQSIGAFAGDRDEVTVAGRWPPNVVLDESQAAELDRQTGVTTSRIGKPRAGTRKPGETFGPGQSGLNAEVGPEYDDQGGASRFFPTFRYEAKAPSSERPRIGGGTQSNVANPRCKTCGKVRLGYEASRCVCPEPDLDYSATEQGSSHPTVKPVDLMAWLVRLVTPPGGLVLDPFAGSGTTAEACIVEGFRCILIEKSDEYLSLIVQRLRKPIQPAFDLAVNP